MSKHNHIKPWFRISHKKKIQSTLYIEFIVVWWRQNNLMNGNSRINMLRLVHRPAVTERINTNIIYDDSAPSNLYMCCFRYDKRHASSHEHRAGFSFSVVQRPTALAIRWRETQRRRRRRRQYAFNQVRSLGIICPPLDSHKHIHTAIPHSCGATVHRAQNPPSPSTASALRFDYSFLFLALLLVARQTTVSCARSKAFSCFARTQRIFFVTLKN